jgi:hypothetical protein
VARHGFDNVGLVELQDAGLVGSTTFLNVKFGEPLELPYGDRIIKIRYDKPPRGQEYPVAISQSGGLPALEVLLPKYFRFIPTIPILILF